MVGRREVVLALGFLIVVELVTVGVLVEHPAAACGIGTTDASRFEPPDRPWTARVETERGHVFPNATIVYGETANGTYVRRVDHHRDSHEPPVGDYLDGAKVVPPNEASYVRVS